MLINLFQTIRSSGVPCTLRELLDLLGALENHLVYSNLDDFYFLSRAILVKDEKHYDKFDRAFEIYFKGIERLEDIFQALIPEDWLRKAFEKELDPDELKKIKSLGGLEKLLEEFKKRLEEQKERHEGGNKWIGTNGTSPYGHGGQNPEGIRMGGAGKSNKAVKVWEQRNFSNLDDSVIIGTREMQMALRRLRKFARQGTDLELDMDERKLSLGVKQLEDNPWDGYESTFGEGTEFDAEVVKVTKGGVVVDLAHGIEGFAPSRHIQKEDGAKAVAGETLKFRVIEFNKDAQKIVVSHTVIHKEVEEAVKKTTAKSVKKVQQSQQKSTLGDMDELVALKESMSKNENDDK